jgi:hypothetical protein
MAGFDVRLRERAGTGSMTKLYAVKAHVRRSPRRRVNFERHTDLMVDALWLIVLDALRGEMEAG